MQPDLSMMMLLNVLKLISDKSMKSNLLLFEIDNQNLYWQGATLLSQGHLILRSLSSNLNYLTGNLLNAWSILLVRLTDHALQDTWKIFLILKWNVFLKTFLSFRPWWNGAGLTKTSQHSNMLDQTLSIYMTLPKECS